MKIVSGILFILLVAVAAGLLIQQQAGAKLRAENESLRQQLDQLARLQADNQQLSNRLAQIDAAAQGQTIELMKLRNEAGMMRKQSAEIAALRQKNQELNDALNSVRNPPPVKTPPRMMPRVNAPDNAAETDLGAIQLVNQTPRQFDLGGGRICTIVPTIDASGNYDLKVAIDFQTADGRPEHVATEVNTAPGPVRLNVGDYVIGFTPTVSPAP